MTVAPQAGAAGSGPSCANVPGHADGVFCGNDLVSGDPNTLYSCVGGDIAVVTVCATGCQETPNSLVDRCNPMPTKVMDCKTDDGLHSFYLIFNKAPISEAGAAVMAAHTTPGSPSTDFHPLYGPTRYEWTGGGLSMTFEYTVPLDWSTIVPVDGCYSPLDAEGGYYMFEDLQFTSSGGLRGSWHSPDKYLIAPGATCPPGDPPTSDPPLVGISCELAPGVQF